MVLQLPQKVCVSRVAARVGHEGGVKPEQGQAVVGRMMAQMRAPSASEGLASIMVGPCVWHALARLSMRACRPVGNGNVYPYKAFPQQLPALLSVVHRDEYGFQYMECSVHPDGWSHSTFTRRADACQKVMMPSELTNLPSGVDQGAAKDCRMEQLYICKTSLPSGVA